MTNAASKDVSEQKFSGKEGKGLTFKEFDKKVLSWARKKYGNAYGKPLWEDTLPDIKGLDLTDDLDYYTFLQVRRYTVPLVQILDGQMAGGE